ncbi:MAG: UDP-3-O-acyl-N-acetylglucosamine deacetylase [Bacillus sp. (in: firmicutes)]
MQKSIKHSVQCRGISITGEYTTIVTFYPANPDTGIVFIRDDLSTKPQIECRTEYARTDSRWTSLVKNNIHVEHTEHLLAAITGLGIDNINIHLSSPHIPVVSQFSSQEFVEVLLQAEPVIQHTPKRYLTITEPIWVFDSFIFNEQRYDNILLALPAEEPTFTYLLDYPNKQLPSQIAHYKLTSDKEFISELSSARSYIMDYEYDFVEKLLGHAMNQCLVISSEKDEKLSWENEPARHKLVDLIGDLSTIGTPIKGHFIGIRTGHKTNIAMAKKINEFFRGDKR